MAQIAEAGRGNARLEPCAIRPEQDGDARPIDIDPDQVGPSVAVRIGSCERSPRFVLGWCGERAAANSQQNGDERLPGFT